MAEGDIKYQAYMNHLSKKTVISSGVGSRRKLEKYWEGK